jgi:hypothetical protein
LADIEKIDKVNVEKEQRAVIKIT